ncbi:hypothetical protein AciX9_4490 (plasmid) [Granulicella tundricola MP5ACTX9]|uniref:Uncharacterized protein n=1 Tax=Granulicella tundricola (strain ATCC BAA-1859 / DSM 23138 / MP5ACTX9) TaxID=1198114 RepID=E8X7K1_GRATM|nr:hypothetical protein AciX9_4490 [Granulicella tundricola MP5ACTX9]
MNANTIIFLFGCYCTVNFLCALALDRSVASHSRKLPPTTERVLSLAVFTLLGIPLVTLMMLWHSSKRSDSLTNYDARPRSQFGTV